MIFLKYKQPKAEYVQFQRFVMGLLILMAVLSEDIFFVNIFLILSIISLFTTVNYSPTTFIYKFISLLRGKPFFTTAPQYSHSYIVHRLAEIFEDFMRIAGGFTIIYVYTIVPLVAWIISSFMAIAMLISSFFGFCLSALMYIGYKFISKKFGK